PVSPELMFATDETGVQQGLGTWQRIIGPKGKKVQHQQRSGDRENTTVIVTICAYGTSLPPAVIFKGELFQTTWRQNNPLNILGHSSKGYIDGEIGVKWIKQFDQQTCAKAMDGHNSHYTRGFLKYAWKHCIHVLCYPSHSTHIYQGLDVVIFSVLKQWWTEARDEYKHQRGHKVDKTNFLSVYTQAHTQALSKENIITAFWKTGIVPLDRNVITDEMLAPSTTSSSRGFLPIQQVSPVRVMEDLIHRQLA
ncbi:DDE-domain-containing protein, partial [Tricholoma matsutake]